MIIYSTRRPTTITIRAKTPTRRIKEASPLARTHNQMYTETLMQNKTHWIITDMRGITRT